MTGFTTKEYGKSTQWTPQNLEVPFAWLRYEWLSFQSTLLANDCFQFLQGYQRNLTPKSSPQWGSGRNQISGTL